MKASGSTQPAMQALMLAALLWSVTWQSVVGLQALPSQVTDAARYKRMLPDTQQFHDGLSKYISLAVAIIIC